ncbi:NAD(P)/FAD-dependent oxidoreductase [Tepidibacter hydrothermalis]|uniref:NAD(P)/FAD-dependent oxidoreductase n=1 Tax=Tepidibacter hydrothermalis TaxID=3036126 RepID=A0ABY8EHV7_9FIRM|nr:NAD(P)/FAD-dependent oxidoreductase [Tepidibacter hydrothermalis]WFD12376.1 NAD(P)/FAD-dependent oxidoreductase [Tepidibacter hydrothermalis]
MDKKVVVIGGGAAGMIAASIAGGRGLDVTLIEKNSMVGKKLLITGKGRCNITNDCDVEELIENVPVNGKFLYSAFYTFTNMDVIELFNKLGVKTKVERGNRVFPVSDRSSDVVEALKKYMKQNNVKVLKGEVDKVESNDGCVKNIVLKNGKSITCDSVIIATGGASYPQTGSTGDGYKFARQNGHNINKIKPSLVPLETKEKWVKNLQGLTLRNISIKVLNKNNKKVYDDFGELNFNSYGISGPVILSASCYIKDMDKNDYRVIIDLKPALSNEKLDNRIQRDFDKYSTKDFEEALKGLLPQKMIPTIVELTEIDPKKIVNQISKEERKKLIYSLKNMTLNIKKYRPIKDAIVTSGGVKINEINPSTMESKLIEGLYFAGEVIDVDAYTGGFNLQIAFSTGYLAGMNC